MFIAKGEVLDSNAIINPWKDPQVVAGLFDVAMSTIGESVESDTFQKIISSKHHLKKAIAREIGLPKQVWPESNNTERAVNGTLYGIRLVNFAITETGIIYDQAVRSVKGGVIARATKRQGNIEPIALAQLLTERKQATELLKPARFTDEDNLPIMGISNILKGRRKIIDHGNDAPAPRLKWKRSINDYYAQRDAAYIDADIPFTSRSCPAVQAKVFTPDGRHESAAYALWNTYVHAKLGLDIPQYSSSMPVDYGAASASLAKCPFQHS